MKIRNMVLPRLVQSGMVVSLRFISLVVSTGIFWLLSFASGSALFTTPIKFINGGPSPGFRSFRDYTAFFVALLNVRGLTLLLVGVAGFISLWHTRVLSLLNGYWISFPRGLGFFLKIIEGFRKSGEDFGRGFKQRLRLWVADFFDIAAEMVDQCADLRFEPLRVVSGVISQWCLHVQFMVASNGRRGPTRYSSYL